jgi:L,D-peptidoglycan transpeptidase YkuD (ErfK/YbiS/YcfS/YnhG family)
MSARLATLALLGVVACLAGVALVGPAASSATLPPYRPERLSHLGDSKQAVVVTAAHWGATHATLRAYRQDADGGWHLALGPWRARLGWGGMVRAARRRQSTGTTPAGTFRLGPAFGSEPDPGTGLGRYRRIDRNDYWVYDPSDPSTYNVLEPYRSKEAQWRRSWAERLKHWGRRQYRYAVVLRFNLPGRVHWSQAEHQEVAGRTADTRRGGGIFLHVNGSGATDGCVSVSRPHMRRVLRWLDSTDKPRIVIGPRRAITRM